MIKSKKGFSLIEVLVSLGLLLTLFFSLLEQQRQAKQLLTLMTYRAKASQYLDQIDETLYLNLDKFQQPPMHYQLSIHGNKNTVAYRLTWFDTETQTRTRFFTDRSL